MANTTMPIGMAGLTGRDEAMSTMSGYENGYDLEPHTQAGQMLRALGQSGGSMVVAEDGPNRLQTYMYFDDEGADQPFVEPELYDYVSDGVVFEEAADAGMAHAIPTKSFLRKVGRKVFEAGRIDEGDDRGKYFLSLSMRKPGVVYQENRAAFQESATGVAGEALVEEVKETFEGALEDTKEAFEALWTDAKEALKRDDKEAARAVSVVCAQVIFEHLEQLGNPSMVDLIGSIQESHPELPKEPQFRAISGRLRERMRDDPVAAQEAYKQTFANMDRQQLAKEMEPVPAFHEFCKKYRINPSKVLEG